MNIATNKWTGWVVAGLLGCFIAFSGFQAGAEKTGVVDLNRVLSDSEIGKKNEADLRNALALRSGLLDFISTYKVLTTDQANKLRDLTLKPNPTDADKAEIERIKKEVIAADAKRNELLQKANPTEADRLQLQDYNNRSNTMAELLARWNQEFQNELDQLESQVRATTVNKAKETVKEVSKAQGFTIVLESTVAPYGANDITDATIKALNAKK